MQNKLHIPVAVAFLLFGAWLVSGQERKPMVKKVTPVLFVAEIEPCLKFWEGLGFQKTMEVPEGNPSSATGGLRAGKLGFILLQKENIELMYQSYASVEKDMPAIASSVRQGPTFLYVEVQSLDTVRSSVKNAPVYMAERTTFYGSKEIGVKDPAGHFVTFAEFPNAAPQK